MSYFIPPHVRSIRSEGGVVLLNLQSGAYFTLNSVGVLVWEALKGGSTREGAIAALKRRFSVDEERLARDIDPLLERLIKKGLLARGAARPVKSGGSAVPEAKEELAKALSDRDPSQKERFALPFRLFWSVAAMVALVGMDVLLQIAGFARFHRFVSAFQTRSRRALDPADAARICAAVDAASAFYFKRAWCLQRSAAATCLLRLRGLPAQLVIGVRRVPFMAHAWVEIGGNVVNDSPRVRAFHEILERC